MIRRSQFAALAATLLATTLHAQELAPAQFAWRAPLDTAAHQGLVRVGVPAEALARLQSPSADDLRVFDAQGRPVPFALAAPPASAAPARLSTRHFTALPLHAADAGARPPAGSVQVRVANAGGPTVWVDLQAPAAAASSAAARRLPAALFDTRGVKDSVTTLVVTAQVPANVPVHFSVSTSPDLANWTPVAATGRIFRFDGEGAPANQLLELREPLRLEGRYLRLDWAGQDGVVVEGITGVLPAVRPSPPAPATTLAEPQADGPAVRQWQLPFATPIAQLELGTSQANTLVPVRILGRNQPSEPWQPLGHTVVYRLGAPGQESTNPPAWLARPSMRWLRVEATHGARLEGVPLTARVQFKPLDLVFVAGTAGPYVVAAGRPDTPAAALPLGMLAAASQVQVDALPAARLGEATTSPLATPSAVAAWLPANVDARTAGLWAVLVVGVLVLGAVAWSLLKQTRREDM